MLNSETFDFKISNKMKTKKFNEIEMSSTESEIFARIQLRNSVNAIYVPIVADACS